MRLFGFGLLGAAVVELFIIPAVAGACRGAGCATNADGVGMLHAAAVGSALGGILVNWPAIAGYLTKR